MRPRLRLSGHGYSPGRIPYRSGHPALRAGRDVAQGCLAPVTAPCGGTRFPSEKNAEELVSLVHSQSLLEAAIGMATINSLLPVDESVMLERNAGDILLEKGTGKNVAVIGHFPFLPKVRQQAANLWVLENNPLEGDFGPEQAEEFLPQADVVAITGTSITNHTFDGLIRLCRPDAFVLMLGDSVPFTPLLFDHRVDALCGTVVSEPDKVLRCVSQGGNYRQIQGVKRLTVFKHQQ